MRLRLLIVVSFWATCALIPGPAGGADSTYRIRIGFPSLAFAYMPYYIAQEKGIYQRHGIESEYIQMGTSIQPQAVVAGNINYFTSVSTGISGAVAGLPLVIVISFSDANLTRSLNPFSIMVTSSASGGSVTLSWRAPTKNTDGSILTNLAGYRVHYGTAPGNYTASVRLSDHEMTSVVIEDLQPAHWYFAVTAYNSVGLESDFSNPVSTLIQ